MNNETLQTLLDTPAILVDSKSNQTQHQTELVMDFWGMRQGESLLQESPKLQQMGLSAYEMADLHGLAFLPDLEFHEQSQDPVRRKFMEELTQGSEFQVLKDSTKLNPIAAQISALAFGKEFCALKNTVKTSPQTKSLKIACLSSASKAAKAASGELTDFTHACEAFGLGEGKPGGSLDSNDLSLLFKRFQSHPMIRQVAKLAGCYRKVAEGCHTIKGKDGLDDFNGAIQGSELSRILPSELLRFALPELEIEFLRRFAECQLMIREFESTDPAGLGAVVVVVDESGSMSGSKVEHAKAISLVFAWLAKSQGRWCGLVSFSGGTGHSVLALPPDKSKTSELLDWAVSFIGGGSDQDLPVRQMPAIFEEIGASDGTTDLVFISDAELHIKPKDAEAFLQWKASVNAKLTSLVIGAEPGDLVTISDKVHVVETLNPDSVRIEQVFSI